MADISENVDVLNARSPNIPTFTRESLTSFKSGTPGEDMAQSIESIS